MALRLPQLPLRINKTIVLMLCLFVISYVFFILHQLPVKTVVHWLPQKTLQRSNLQLNGLSGTIWNGQTAQLRLSGFSLSNLSWQLHALPLLWGDIVLAFKFRQTDGFGKGNATTDFSGETLQLSAVQSGFPAAQLMPLFYGFPIALEGQVVDWVQSQVAVQDEQTTFQALTEEAMSGA